MEVDTATRYRSRILREMNANRTNPFNSPPSSTGSHGTASPTMSSVFSDPDGESTRRLNEDIARVTGGRKMTVNWEAAHRKWPEFYGMPRKRDAPLPGDDDTDMRPLSSESKENKPPALHAQFDEDSTQDAWLGSRRTRAEMQPRVDNDSDLSAILSKPPTRMMAHHALAKNARHPSPLAKVHTRGPSDPISQLERRPSISNALERLRRASTSPKSAEHNGAQDEHGSPHLSSAKSSFTAVARSPGSVASPNHNASNARSFFMPDVSHLGDFVTGTLRFSGSNQNGVPVFVKHGQVHDQRERPAAASHAQVDGLEVPKDEEKIFVSMDMIREEILSLQGHYDKIQDYAEGLQQQVERLETQLKSQRSVDVGFGSDRINEQVLTQKTRLEAEFVALQSRLEQASRKATIAEIENESLVQEKDRAIQKLQEACNDINKLTRKLGVNEKELQNSQRQLGSTDQIRQDNDTLRQDLVSIKHTRDSLELENESLRSDSNSLRKEQESLIGENISLRSSNKSLMGENEDLRENLDGAQHELDAAREEIEILRQDIEHIDQEKTTLKGDNASLVRHNEKYFSENKILRRENSGFERSVHDLHDENVRLNDEVELLKQQLDHFRGKGNYSAKADDETEENTTSAFFLQDITNTNGEKAFDNTETREMPAPPDLTEQDTRNTTKQTTAPQNGQLLPRQKSKRDTRQASKSVASSQKVSFSIPEASAHDAKNASVLANQGSKRRTTQATYQDSFKGPFLPDVGDLSQTEDTTGFLSVDNATQDQRDMINNQRQSRGRDNTSHSQKSLRVRSRSRSAHKRISLNDTTTGQEVCPALSNEARRVLDELCEHNCRNCTVCARITSHHGLLSAKELAEGKKRVTISRPVPVTDRDLSVEDPTMRPAHSPGHALALVIKSLEDEAHHLQLELSRLQAQYNSSDKSLGRRERLALAESIRTTLKRLEAKNDQVYSLYDVLEGQKAAGQAMSEEEIEMTVLNITGMTVRDVTGGTLNLTWEGIVEG